VSDARKARLLWWVFFVLSAFVIYKVLTLDIDKITTVEVNATVIDATKAKLHRFKE